jgi:hypothetical protein
MNLSSVKSQVRTDAGVADESAWQASDPVALPLRPGVERLLYSTTVVTDGVGVDISVPVYVIGRGGAGETAWYTFDLAPAETNVAKLQRLIYARFATQCAPGTGLWLSAHIDWLEPCEACPTAQVTIRLRSDSSEKVAAVGLDAAGTGLEVTVLT